jgi:RNA recognition motif-containing protein
VKNIFVSNLDFSITEHDLRALFEGYGAVEKATVISDRDTGRSRGFGFVEMTNPAEADTAIAELDGRDWNGRALKVNEALPKGDGARGGGAGRGGFDKKKAGAGGGGFGGKRGGSGGGDPW